MNAVTGERWTKNDIHELLSKGSWFGSLPEPMKDNILARGEIVRFEAGDTIFKVGDPVDGIYAVLEGDVRTYAPDDDGGRIFFRALGPGSWFGNAPLYFDPAMHVLEVRCASAATALYLPELAYREMTESDPATYRAFVQLMMAHSRHAVRLLLESRSEAPRRAARALLRLCRIHGVAGEGGTRLAIHLSQADLASLVGVSRQYMNELIARWEAEGVLRWNGKSQPLLDIGRLRGLLGPLDAWIMNTDDWI